MYSYSQLARYYDILMSNVDYIQWTNYIQKIFKMLGKDPQYILDTACGTGNITIPLSKHGYKMWGIDLSEEMLSEADNKARAEKQNIKFLKQNITQMQINRKFDVVLCMCDGVNYILKEADLSNYLTNVYNVLEKDGIFIFDVSSYYKLSEILGNNTILQEDNNIYYIWENNYDGNTDIIEMNLTFFVPENNLFRKFEEYHMQKAYNISTLKEFLSRSNFGLLGIFDEFTFDLPNEESERIFFVAQKK